MRGDDRLFGASGVDLDLSLQDDTGQREELTWWIAGKAELPSNHRRYVHLLVNGIGTAPRPFPGNYSSYSTSAIRIYRDAQSPGGDFLSSWYPDNGQDKGELRKLQIWRQTNNASQNSLNNAPQQHASLTRYLGSGGAHDAASYRWNWRRRATGVTNNINTNFFKLIDAVNTNASGDIDVALVQSEMDVEQWGRILALERGVGNIDSYGHTNGQNMFAYRPSGDVTQPHQWQLLAYDVELGLGAVNSSTSESVFAVNRDPILTRLLTTNLFRRAFWRGFYDLVNEDHGPMRNGQVRPVIEANRAALSANGYSTTPTGLTNWLNQRKDNLRSPQLASVRPCFAFITPSHTTNASQILLQGRAPVEVVHIFINGDEADVAWTTVTNWQVTMPLNSGQNVFGAAGHGRDRKWLPPNTQDGTCGGNSDSYTNRITITRN